MSIVFNAGTFTGDVTLEKVSSYRDGDVRVQIRIVNGDKPSMLLDNVNHICQLSLEIEGTKIETQGELVHLGTYRNGGIGIDIVVPNDQKGQKLLAKVKDSGSAVIAFSSIAAPKGDDRETDPKLDL